ncbi:MULTISPECIES: CHAT domain-containing protein [unclassified Crossiella]|uniref:CHAT domain-containing protein n=1 Tax=unclassified Crossiella TaxID=2620835 RepID=UPI0024941EF3|nr:MULTISPECIES: CHAT domain-containing protein [unclassified Crossiella]
MTAGPGGEFTVDSDSPFALALTAAREAVDRVALDQAYRWAVQLADAESAELRTALAAEHVSRLRELGDSSAALTWCADYLTRYGAQPTLLLLRAETNLSRGDYRTVGRDLVEARRSCTAPADHALLCRLEGLVARQEGRYERARERLRSARKAYAALGNAAAVAMLAEDLRMLALSEGRPVVLRRTGGARSPQDRLSRSEELRIAGRYEEALAELAPALAGPLDAALRYFYLEARVRLLRLVRADEEAAAALPELFAAAESSARPGENSIAAQRFADGDRFPVGLLAVGEHWLFRVRWLIRAGEFAEAEQLLLTGAENAEWQLAMAEFLLATARNSGDAAVAGQAVAHSRDCLAAADALPVLRIAAWRVQGHAYLELDPQLHQDRAARALARAHRAEEELAARQPTDAVRLRMLHAAATEFDEQIRWAAEQGGRVDDLVAVAIEAARGAAILPQLKWGATRALPAPGDRAGARRWIRRAVRGLPRDQWIWLLHAAPDTVHSVLIGRTWRGVSTEYYSVGCQRTRLISTIDALAGCWRNKGARQLAEAPPGTTELDRLVLELEQQLGMSDRTELPAHVRRITVVAGGELAEIPFGLLSYGKSETVLGRRYALSTLPCLAARAPLHRRSRGQRGTRPPNMLVLHGPNLPNLPVTPAATITGRLVLDGARATATELGAALAAGTYRVVRVDSHGDYSGDPANAAMLLAEGRVSPERFQDLDLSRTGTIALGVCESAMGKRIGRDEHLGFVRVALAAGASAVLAARWETVDLLATRTIDRFEQLLRRYPRDVALFRAQRELDSPDQHPTRWAALSLCGDTGYQTRRGPLLRWLTSIPQPESTPGAQR